MSVYRVILGTSTKQGKEVNNMFQLVITNSMDGTARLVSVETIEEAFATIETTNLELGDNLRAILITD
jgi:hypothetical protein